MTEIKDSYLLDCPEYGDYLDLYIDTHDIKYIENIEVSRNLVSLGFRANIPILSEQQYSIRKSSVNEIVYPTKKLSLKFSDGLTITDTFLRELQLREPPNVNKNLSTIIFLTYKSKDGTEISSYIDYDASLRETNKNPEKGRPWRLIFEMTKMLQPRPTDISYYNWRSNQIYFNDSENYKIKHDQKLGLCFMYKGDRKLICIDTEPNANDYNDNFIKTMVYSEKYGNVILYDHIVRRKI